MDLQVLIASGEPGHGEIAARAAPVNGQLKLNPPGESSRARIAAPAVITLMGSGTLVMVLSSAVITGAGTVGIARHSHAALRKTAVRGAD
jgi:hypothetical protein